MTQASDAPLLEAVDLVKHYQVGRGLLGGGRVVHALNGVSLSLRAGETLAIVGESGCGKTTLARCLAWLLEPSAGSITLAGEDLRDVVRSDPKRFRRLVQIVFQDPYASLNPRRSIFETVSDPLRLHDLCPRGERRAEATRLLAQVGLSRDMLDRYPHELSGGQRQRVAIARALAVRPSVMICDEPVSALDVSVQAQVINLLRDLQQELGLAYLFISHNLALVRHIADRIAVMYLGQIVEEGRTAELRRTLRHPYSQALFAAAPAIRLDQHGVLREALLAGDVPSPIEIPPGCSFHGRCRFREAICLAQVPTPRTVDERVVRCHLADRTGSPPC